MTADKANRLLRAARIARRLAGPAEALVSTQRLVLDEIRQSDPQEAVEDLENVLKAAQRLVGFVNALRRGDIELGDDEKSAARLRHDLRTPINAIIGYSELVLEDFADVLPPGVKADCDSVVEAARQLLIEVETLDADGGEDGGDDAILAARLETAITAAGGAAQRVETGRILIVDDDAANLDVLDRQLTRRGHRVRAAGSAEAAIALLEADTFDLALIDILMPGTNGIELLTRLKADMRWRHLSVLMISGLGDTSAVAACITAGADDYLQKPVDPVVLHARVEACLERTRWRERERAYLAEIEREKERADALLSAILPAPIIHRLNGGERHIADRFDAVSIVFADIVGFTPMVARTEPTALVRTLAALFEDFDDIADRHGVEKIKTIGDAYMAAAGIPHHRADHAHAALGFARELLTSTPRSGPGLKLRIGIHSGPVIAGLIGRKRFVYDVWGDTVNFASRLEASGQEGRIHVSEEYVKAIGYDLDNAEKRHHELKGIGWVSSYILG